MSFCWTEAWQRPEWYFKGECLLIPQEVPIHDYMHLWESTVAVLTITHFVTKIRQDISFGMMNCRWGMYVYVFGLYPFVCSVIGGKVVSFTYLKSCPAQEILLHLILYPMTGGLVFLHSHQSIKSLHKTQTPKWMPFCWEEEGFKRRQQKMK